MNHSKDIVARPTRFRWVVVAIQCAVGFVLYVDRVNISVSAPHMASEFGLSSQWTGNILSAFLFGYAFGLVPGGWLADRFGSFRVMTAAGISWAALTAMTGCVQPHYAGHFIDPGKQLFVLRFLLGLAESCAFPTFARTLANWVQRGERGTASGLIHMGSNLGGMSAPVLASAIAIHYGWRDSFLLSAVLTLAVTLTWFWTVTELPSQHPRVSASELALIASDKEEMQPERLDSKWFGMLARSQNAYALCLSMFFFSLSSFVFLTWFYIYFVTVRHAGDMYSAFLTSLTYAAGAVGALVGGVLCDRAMKRWGNPWGRRTVPMVAIALAGILCVIAPVLRNNTAAGVVFSTAAGLGFVAAPGIWATVIDITRRGTGLLGGLLTGSGNLGGALGTIAFPWLVARVGWELALQIAGCTGVISGLLWLFVDASRQIDVVQDARPWPATSAGNLDPL